jgi:hypothetical protein
MEKSGSDPDIGAIIAQTEDLITNGGMTVDAAISGLKKIIAGLQQRTNLPEARLQPIRDLIEKLQRENTSKRS